MGCLGSQQLRAPVSCVLLIMNGQNTSVNTQESKELFLHNPNSLARSSKCLFKDWHRSLVQSQSENLLQNLFVLKNPDWSLGTH